MIISLEDGGKKTLQKQVSHVICLYLVLWLLTYNLHDFIQLRLHGGT